MTLSKPADIRAEVESSIVAVARDQGHALPPLRDDLSLADSGLDSLCLAVIVATLEDKLGFDPFQSPEEVAFPTTIGEFVALYERAGATALIP